MLIEYGYCMILSPSRGGSLKCAIRYTFVLKALLRSALASALDVDLQSASTKES